MEDIKIKEEASSEPSGQTKSQFGYRRLFAFVLFLILLITLLIIFILFRQEKVFEKKPSTEETPTEALLKGEIYLTLSPQGEETPNIYKLDLDTMFLEEYFPESPYRNYMAKFTSTAESMAFVRGYDDNTNQIMIFNLNTEEFFELTPRQNIFPRNPVFSPDDTKLAYWIYTEVDAPLGEYPEDNSISVISAVDWTEEEVAKGAFPFFTPDGEFLIYLKNDGLYSLNLETENEKKVVDMDSLYLDNYIAEGGADLEELEKVGLPGWTTFRFALSPNGKNLIITDTVSSNVLVFERTSQGGFEYSFNLMADAPNWPNFSPDSEYFVIQEFETGETTFPKLSIFSFDDLEFQEGFGLGEAYDSNYFWVSDWIVR
jgi:hypothetical protein